MDSVRDGGPWGRGWHVPLAVGLLTLAVQGVVVVLLGLPGPLPADAQWQWGYEHQAVASALLRGEGLADPFRLGTGATAWCGCVYPALLAGVLHLGGGVGVAAQWGVLVLHALLSAAVGAQLVRLGRALGDGRLGVLAGVLWAFSPQGVHTSATVVSDHVLAALALTSVLVAAARAGGAQRSRRLLVPGFVLGLAGLVNPALLALAPAVALYLVRGGGVLEAVRRGLVLALPVALVLLPWCVRNQLHLGSPALKSNLAVELRVGNHDGARGEFLLRLHPSHDPQEGRIYAELGEVAYADRCRGLALRWIGEHPGTFLGLCLRRAVGWWFGRSPFEPEHLPGGHVHERDLQGWVAWVARALAGLAGLLGLLLYRDDRGGAVLVRGTLLLFPLVYLVTHVSERYRYPLEPLLALVGAWLALGALRRIRAGQEGRSRR